MQTSTASPVSNSTVTSNPTTVTKSKEQILIQSSGAMIAVIVIGIIVILTVLLIAMKTYNRRTHVSRVLGPSNGSKPRQRRTQSTMPLNTTGIASVSGSIPSPSHPALENSFRFPRVELNTVGENRTEQPAAPAFRTSSGSTAVTIHDIPSMGNT